MPDINQTIALARLFGQRVQEALTRSEFREVCHRNKCEPAGSSVCHSHDYCDANVLMGEAWEEMFGRPFPMGEVTDEDAALWNDAWAIAKAADFFA